MGFDFTCDQFMQRAHFEEAAVDHESRILMQSLDGILQYYEGVYDDLDAKIEELEKLQVKFDDASKSLNSDS